MISKFLLFPYYLTLKIRNRLYDNGTIKAECFDIPVISIGNLTAGGTGKTPMVELMVRMLSEERRVAVLSRGYRRATKGFKLVETTSTAAEVGDEPLQIKRKFPSITVAVDKDRNHAIAELLKADGNARPEVILLDDAMQYRKLAPSQTMALIDYNRPIFKDELIPLGRLRDLPDQIRRAENVIITKSPEYLNQWEVEKARQANRLRPEQNLFFTKIKYCQPKAVFEGTGDNRYIYSKEVYVFSGIADDRFLIFHLSGSYDWIAHRKFSDHHRFNRLDIRTLRRFAHKHPRALLLTTEKDAQRLLHCEGLGDEVRRRLFFLPIETIFLTWEEHNRFKEMLLKSVPQAEATTATALPETAGTIRDTEVGEAQEPALPQEAPAQESSEEKPDYLKPMEPVNGGLLF